MAIESILGAKIGMSQVFNENGVMTPVTAVQAGPCTVTQIRTPAKDGYSALQLGFGEPRNLNQPEKGHLRRSGKLFRFLREIRTKNGVREGRGPVFFFFCFSPMYFFRRFAAI